jgi:4'-phosphopantetheinyl transferase EntD
MLLTSIQRSLPRSAPYLTALFPFGVAAAELFGGADAMLLSEAERACIAAAVPQRVAEFAAGRMCARHAMREAGLIDCEVLAGTDRAPQWPAALVGSITHTHDYAAAVVACRRRIKAIGIDVEIVGRVTQDLWRLIFVEEEREMLSALKTQYQVRASTLMFAAKEAFYKLQYPLSHAWLDFSSVAVEIDHATNDVGEFIIRTRGAAAACLEEPLGGTEIAGRYRFDGGRVCSGVALGCSAARGSQ